MAAAGVLPPLKLIMFLGSTRPNRLCKRVSIWVQRGLERRGHIVQVVDPADLQLPMLVQPHFAYPPGKAPAVLEKLASDIRDAEGYVMVSPEYNHTVPPALSNTLSHFGGSLYAWKPSAICTYSSGQWGGQRAAMALRPMLSELGCLPVSSILAVPKAQEVLDAQGEFHPGQSEVEWDAYAAMTWVQLEWLGNAMRAYKAVQDPAEYSRPNRAMADRSSPGV